MSIEIDTSEQTTIAKNVTPMQYGDSLIGLSLNRRRQRLGVAVVQLRMVL